MHLQSTQVDEATLRSIWNTCTFWPIIQIVGVNWHAWQVDLRKGKLSTTTQYKIIQPIRIKDKKEETYLEPLN